MVRDARSVMHRSRYRVRGTLSLGHFSLSTGCFEARPTIIVSEQHLDWAQRDPAETYRNEKPLCSSKNNSRSGTQVRRELRTEQLRACRALGRALAQTDICRSDGDHAQHPKLNLADHINGWD